MFFEQGGAFYLVDESSSYTQAVRSTNDVHPPPIHAQHDIHEGTQSIGGGNTNVA